MPQRIVRLTATGAVAGVLLLAATTYATTFATTNATRADGAAPPVYLTANNFLANPGFEGLFRAAGANELGVAEGWEPWYDGRLTRPEFKDEPYVRYRDDGGVEAFSLRVFHGVKLQKFFTFSSGHDAGFYQTVAVPPGSRVRFSIWVQTWSSDCDDPCVSPTSPCRFDSENTHGTYRVSAGVHPAGAVPAALGEFPPEGTVWTVPFVYDAYDKWFKLELETVAVSDHVTVFVRGNPEWGVKHNDSYWDDARLEVLDPVERPFAAFVPYAVWRRPTTSSAVVASQRAREEPAPSGLDAGLALRGPVAEPAPPGSDIRIDYPVRAYPAQENFGQPTCSDLEFENVLLKNYGLVDVQLEGWTLADRQGNSFVFPRLSLAPGDHVRVWTKSGDNVADGRFTDVYWNRTEPVWDGPADEMPFDEATLRDDAGSEIAKRGYP